MDALLVAQAAATFALTGLVWVVQLAIYPNFARVGVEAFPTFHAAYSRAIGKVAGPLMLLELVTGVRLMARFEAGTSMAGPFVAFALIVLIWGSTLLVQMPLHRILARGFDAARARQLSATNWVRTGAWSLRAVLVFSMLTQHSAASGM